MLTKFVANVSFVTRSSKTTPLLAAAKQRRVLTVKSLILSNTDSSVADCYGCPLLCYASMGGDIKTMKLLITAEAPTDDGGLQDSN
jgi:Ankyrin repeats (many copies)